MKYFNIAGPCNSAKHYMIDASTRLKGVEQLIDTEQYFVIHAARQSGKTTYLHDLLQRLNAGGKYYSLCCSLETVQGIIDPKDGIPAIIRCIRNRFLSTDLPHNSEFTKDIDYSDFNGALELSLSQYCKLLDKPFVLLFDEADCLSEGTLITFLRQLRDGYNNRSVCCFVHSIALVGMRNIRDYKAQIRPDSKTLGSSSPFNIVAESLTLQNFTKDEIIQLYQQHTDETGQIFNDDAIELIFEQTQGQPWLVNAIAREVVLKMLQSDYTKPVTAELANAAIQNIILSRTTHIDSLLERLKEPPVRRIIEPMIMGEGFINKESEDFFYTRDMGLIREVNYQIMPANPIYAEIIIRLLSSYTQNVLQDSQYPYQIPRYLKGGRIDMDFLLRDFQQFWRENSQIWVNFYDYKEAAPHLILMAFLQRVINGGGQLIREMATGKKRLDLCLIYEGKRYPIEVKIDRGKKYLEDGLEQIIRYMNIYGCKEGWLVVCNNNPNNNDDNWDERIYMKKEIKNEKTITIVGI